LFSSGTHGTNKTDCHDITEMLLKVALKKTTDLPQVTDKINVALSTPRRDRDSKWGDNTM
jgi:hypothetical protein